MTYSLITGAASGIGFEFAKILAQNGYHLILVDIDAEGLKNAKNKLENNFPVEVHTIVADLCQTDAAEKIYSEVQTRGIFVEILINNAGFGVFGFFHEKSLNRQMELVHLSVFTTTQLTHLFVQEMLERKSGRIMNLASVAAFQPGPLMAVYYASKAYILSLGRAIANELKGSGVSVTTLCPGMTKTGFQAVTGSGKVNFQPFTSSAEKVAIYGYKAMMKGKTVAIPHFYNQVLSQLHRIFPWDLSTQISRSLQQNVRKAY